MNARTLKRIAATAQREPSQAAPDEGPRVIPMTASTAAVDSYDEVVDQASWRLARFLANPIALHQHAPWEEPVGYWRNVRVEDGALRGDLVLYDDATSVEAGKIWRRYLQGGPVACSVGFYPGRTEKRVVDGAERKVLLDCDLEEISVVTIPANPQAVAEARRLAAARAAHTRGASRSKKAPAMEDLKTYLEAKGLDAAALAAKAGMTADEMLSGKMTDEQKTSLATALEMELDELLPMLVDPEAEAVAVGDEKAADAAAAPSPEEVKALLSALGARTVREGIVRASALGQVREEAGPLAARVKALEAERESERREAALDAARRSGVLTPAREKGAVGAYLKSLRTAADVRAYLDTLTPAAPTQKAAEKPGATDDGAVDYEALAKATGYTVEQLRKGADAAFRRPVVR